MTERRRNASQDVVRDNLTDLLRKVLVIAIGVGAPMVLGAIVVLGPSDPLVRWTFPPLLVYLLVYAWVLLRRPAHSIWFSRTTLILFEVVWLVAMVVRLWSTDDVTDGWHGLFPTTWISLITFQVVGFLYFSTRAALWHSGLVIAGVLAAGLTGLLPRDGGAEHVRDLVRYCVSLVVIVLLLHVLARAKSRLALALASAQQATAEAHHMRDMAYRDALTGIANRRRLVEELTFQTGLVGRTHPVAVVYFDLDRFKSVNDEHGHVVGDEVLCRVADAAQSVVRSADLVARLGGEEFVIVAPGTDSERALALAERLRHLLPRRLTQTVGVRVTASFGVTMLRAGETPADVLSRVDALMYGAKASGRDQVVHTLG